MLLIGAGLLLASFQKILAVSPGFTVQGVMTGSVSPTQREVRRRRPPCARSPTARWRPCARIPGVTAAGVTDSIPFGGIHSDGVILAEGYVMAPGESLVSPSRIMASPGYFQALGIPLVRGRLFDERDTADSPRTVIVDERLAKKFWPDRDPLGHRLYFPSDMKDPMAVGPKTQFYTVVGVVGTVKERGLVDADDRVGAYYFPYAQMPRRTITLAVRAAGDPQAVVPAVRQALAAIDPELPLYDVHTMGQRVEESLRAAAHADGAGRGVRRHRPLPVGRGHLRRPGLPGHAALARDRRAARARRDARRRVRPDPARGRRHHGRSASPSGVAGVVALRQVLQAQLFGIGALDPSGARARGPAARRRGPRRVPSAGRPRDAHRPERGVDGEVSTDRLYRGPSRYRRFGRRLEPDP